MSLAREREAQKLAKNAAEQRMREGRKTFVLTVGQNRILIAADSQREARDKLAAYYAVNRRAAPLSHEIMVREARDGEAAEFGPRHRAKPVESERMFDIESVPTRADAPRKEYG